MIPKELLVFFLIQAVFWSAASLKAAWDFNHPRIWAPGNDPHHYVWVVMIGWVVYIYTTVSMCRTERLLHRKKRIAFLLAETKRLLGEKKTSEAEICLNEAKALTGYKYP